MASSRNILISGATGLVGGRLVERLQGETGLRALTRAPERSPRAAAGISWLGWDGTRARPEHLAGCRAIVHLAGEPVFAGRLTAARRRRIRSSRIDSTRSLVASLDALPHSERPATLVCASAVGIYGSRGDEQLDESSPPGRGFLADVCRDWEAAAFAAEERGLRVVTLRIGIVLSRRGGALPMMALPFRLGLGGRIGDGRQWVPWVHLDDLVSLIRETLNDTEWRGPVNATAPNPVRNALLTRSLARALHRPALLPVPAFALRTALGELSDELLDSRRVIPERARERAFCFAHPDIDSALSAELS